LWLIALAIGIVLVGQRRLFGWRELWVGVGLAAALALPSVIWQFGQGWPFVELVRNANQKDLVFTPVAFALNQLFVFDPLFAPIWLSGLIAPFALRELRALRFIPVAYALTAAAIVASGGKDYYLAPAVPPLFVLGAVALEHVVRSARVRAAYLCVALAVAAIGAPMALPILAPDRLAAYERALHVAPKAQERGDSGDAVPPLFSDMLGWHVFVDQVGSAYDELPANERAGTAILVGNYGEAAALDLYGRPYGLPPALSAHNQYFLWGLRGQHPVNLLRVQFHPERLRPYCRAMRVVATTNAPYARDFENGRAIAFCRGVHPNLAVLWPTLKIYI
jgi:hypothetical protein